MTLSRESTHKRQDRRSPSPVLPPQFRTRQGQSDWNRCLRLKNLHRAFCSLWTKHTHTHTHTGVSGKRVREKACPNPPKEACAQRAVARSPSGGRRQKSSQSGCRGLQQGTEEIEHNIILYATSWVTFCPPVFPHDLSMWIQ